MEFTRTPTPPYKGQPPNGTRTHEAGLLDWIASLFRTRTPEYKTARPPAATSNRERSAQL